MHIGKWQLKAEWGHIVFVIVIAAITGWYLQDTLSTSMNRNNVILVYPLSLLILVMSLIAIIKSIKISRAVTPIPTTTSVSSAEKVGSTNEHDQSPIDILKALALLGLLGGFVFSYNRIGLDVATFIFIVCGLLLLGYRRGLFILVYAIAFTFIVIGGAKLLLSYPMPTLLL